MPAARLFRRRAGADSIRRLGRTGNTGYQQPQWVKALAQTLFRVAFRVGALMNGIIVWQNGGSCAADDMSGRLRPGTATRNCASQLRRGIKTGPTERPRGISDLGLVSSYCNGGTAAPRSPPRQARRATAFAASVAIFLAELHQVAGVQRLGFWTFWVGRRGIAARLPVGTDQG